MEYKKIILVLVITALIITPVPTMTQTPEPRDEYPEPLVGMAGVFRIRAPPLNVDKAIELAYTIRNLTYDLFQWEINYNIEGARVQLEIGDMFLNRSLELRETAPRRAAVFAFVAAVHYSHAPPLANPVLGKVIRANLGENGTITNQTVQAVISAAGELRELLVNAIDYASNIGVNTTLPETLLARGDEKIANATSLLEAGNVTEAFMYAVSGYRTYVRAYHVLVRITFIKYIREVVEMPEEELTKKLLEERVPAARIAFEKLPEWVREHVRAKIERGEIKSFNEVASELAERAIAMREQVRLRERENLVHAIRRILERQGVPSGVITDEEIREIIENSWNEGKRGVDLVRQVLQIIREKIEERTGRSINIPTPPIRRPIRPPVR